MDYIFKSKPVWHPIAICVAPFSSSRTYESGRVVVTDCLGISVGLERRVGLDDLLLERAGVLSLGRLGLGGVGIRAVHGVVLQHFLRVLRLSGAGFSGNQRGLVLTLWNKNRRQIEISILAQ